MNAEQKELGKRMMRFRMDKCWTQTEMADYLGVSRPLVVQLERGQGINVRPLSQAKIERKLRMAQVKEVA